MSGENLVKAIKGAKVITWSSPATISILFQVASLNEDVPFTNTLIFLAVILVGEEILGFLNI